MPIEVEIKTANDEMGVYFFFRGAGPNGEFCGSADDLVTAYEMALECLSA